MFANTTFQSQVIEQTTLLNSYDTLPIIRLVLIFTKKKKNYRK